MVSVPRLPDDADLRPITRAEYRRVEDVGLFENERVELVYGAIVRMNAKGPTHEAAIQRLNEILLPALQGRATVRIQSAFAASAISEPEPDVDVTKLGEYFDDHPGDASLVIEVAKSSLAYDRGTKARLYAEAGAPEYWIVNLVDRVVEVHSEIRGGAYRKIIPHGPEATIAPASFPEVQIPLSQLLR